MIDFVTVDYLLNILMKMTQMGYGNARIKCQDGYLHTDEISISSQEIKLRGYLYNYPPSNKVKKFQEDIEKAVRKYYGLEEDEE